MPRVERKPTTTKSEHWLRLAVNSRTSRLDQKIIEAFGFDGDDRISWRSPAQADSYAEYRDQAFLDRLGIGTLKIPLNDFWPSGGPQWDGLAVTDSGKVILVEAKAYPAEATSTCAAASHKSLAKINNSLAAAKQFYGVAPARTWESGFYQYANRFAHLYYLREINQLDAYLVFLNFADAPDVTIPCGTSSWAQATQNIQAALGLPQKGRPEVATLVRSVPEMLSED